MDVASVRSTFSTVGNRFRAPNAAIFGIWPSPEHSRVPDGTQKWFDGFRGAFQRVRNGSRYVRPPLNDCRVCIARSTENMC